MKVCVYMCWGKREGMREELAYDKVGEALPLFLSLFLSLPSPKG